MKAESSQSAHQTTNKKLRWLDQIPYWGFWVLLVYMPFHILLSQSISMATGGLEVWKVAKDIALALLVLFTICLVLQRKIASKSFKIILGLTVVYGLFIAITWLFNTHIHAQSALLGAVHNLRLPGFLILGVGAALLNPGKFVFSLVFKIVLIVSTIVSALAVVQYFLPPDILTHLGYSLERGVRPAFFIDDHPDLMRVMSTLREPNALGAYLILPIAALCAVILKPIGSKIRVWCSVSLLLHAAALFLTFSRSAWLGAALVVILLIWWSKTELIKLFVKRLWPAMLALAVLGVVGVYAMRDTAFVQQYVVHTSEAATSEYSSTDLHYILAREGFVAIIDNPLGYGPGTAGLASIHSPDGQLTENYYIQIGYEFGIFGLGVFIAINVLVYAWLWRRRDTFAIILLSSFWGYVVTNMLLHSWANEAIAAQWWLLAGVALASKRVGHDLNRKQ
jgi:hypothetical protein